MTSLTPPLISKNFELSILGRNISTARQQQNLSQIELARRAGLHRTYLSDVERGRRNLGFLSVVSIARGLGLTVADLTRDVETQARQQEAQAHDFAPVPAAHLEPEPATAASM